MIFLICLALIAAFLWGFQEILDKLALNEITPISSALIKGGLTGIASFLLIVIFFKYIKKDIFPKNVLIKRKAIGFSILAGICASGALLLMLYTLHKTPNIHIIVAIAYTSPLFTLLISRYIFKNIVITPYQVVAIVMIISGVSILAINSK